MSRLAHPCGDFGCNLHINLTSLGNLDLKIVLLWVSEEVVILGTSLTQKVAAVNTLI
jgi:hypothetical protein